MKVRVVEDFTGYPDGTDASRRLFRAGEEVEVPDAFGELVKAKKHAKASMAEDATSDLTDPQ